MEKHGMVIRLSHIVYKNSDVQIFDGLSHFCPFLHHEYAKKLIGWDISSQSKTCQCGLLFQTSAPNSEKSMATTLVFTFCAFSISFAASSSLDCVRLMRTMFKPRRASSMAEKRIKHYTRSQFCRNYRTTVSISSTDSISGSGNNCPLAVPDGRHVHDEESESWSGQQVRHPKARKTPKTAWTQDSPKAYPRPSQDIIKTTEDTQRLPNNDARKAEGTLCFGGQTHFLRFGADEKKVPAIPRRNCTAM